MKTIIFFLITISVAFAIDHPSDGFLGVPFGSSPEAVETALTEKGITSIEKWGSGEGALSYYFKCQYQLGDLDCSLTFCFDYQMLYYFQFETKPRGKEEIFDVDMNYKMLALIMAEKYGSATYLWDFSQDDIKNNSTTTGWLWRFENYTIKTGTSASEGYYAYATVTSDSVYWLNRENPEETRKKAADDF